MFRKKNEQAGLKELGTALKTSGGNPLSFAELQQENLRERPAWQQMGASTIYDPTNLIGAGLGAKALKAGAFDSPGTLSAILKAGAKVDKGIDVAQTAMFKPVGKVLGALATPTARVLADETGAVSPKFAIKTAATVGAGALGYSTADEDASLRDRILRAMAFAAVPAVGPEATDIAARLYGNIPGLGQHGIGRSSVVESAQQAEVLRQAGVKAPISLPEYTGKESLPLRTKISNAVWEIIGANNPGLKANINRPEVFYPVLSFNEAHARIPIVADDMAKTYGADYVRLIREDANGYVLGSNGKRMPALTPNGRIKTVADPNQPGVSVPVMAGHRDLADHVGWYEANGYISAEMADAVRKLSAMTGEISPALKAFGIMPEPERLVGPDGVYISRGQIVQERAPRFRRERAVDNKRPNSSIARKWETEGEALLAGHRYEHPVEAMRKYAVEHLENLNKANLTANLSKIELEGALLGETIRLGDLRVDKAAKTEYEAAARDVREAKKEIKKLATRKGRIDRDARMAGRWVEVNRRRVQTLLNTAADQSLQAAARKNAAADAYTLARQSLDDALSAASELERAGRKYAGKYALAHTDMEDVRHQARVLGNRAEKALGKEVEAETLDNLSYITDTWAYAEQLRTAVAADIERLSDQLAALPFAERQAAEAAMKEPLDKAKSQFRDSLSELRKQRTAAEAAARRESVAAENVRSRITQGKVDELDRAIEQRAKGLRSTLTYSRELGERIEALEANLIPLKQHKWEAKDVIQRAEVLRRQFKDTGAVMGTIDLAGGWEGVPVPIELANAINKYKRVPGPQRGLPAAVLATYDFVNDIFRFLGATADFSRTAIQGLLGIGENPEITRRGIAVGLKSLKDPNAEFLYLKGLESAAIKEGLPSIAHAVGRGLLEIAHSEYLFRGITDDNSTLAALAKHKPLSWFETMFSTPGNVERLERFYDYMRVAKAQGRNADDLRVIRDAAASANAVTGRAAHGVLAPVLGERGSSRVMFAGRFVQAQIETVYSALLVGGIEGDVARRSLLRLGLGGAALTYAINDVQGEDTDWRLFVDGYPNPNFARIRIGGHDVSIFGPWDSLIKGALATYQLDPGSFLRSKMAPAAGIAYDLSLGQWKTPMGDKIGFNRETYNQYLPAPFGLSDTVREAMDTDFSDGGQVGDWAVGAGLNFFGMKNSPLTPRERYNRELESAYPEWQAKAADGSLIEYKRPENPLDDPLFLREYAAKHPDSVPGPASALGKELAEERSRWTDALGKNNDSFMGDERNLAEWKAVRHDLKLQQRTALKPILDKMKDVFGDKEPEPGTPQAWLSSYMDTFDRATRHETVDRDLLDKYQAEWLAQNGPVAQDYIDQFFLAGATNEAERAYLAAMQKLNADGYFDGQIPRYIGMISGMTDDEIYKARGLVAGFAEKYEGVEDATYLTKAYMVLKPLGYSMEQIVDVGNSGKSSHQHYKFKLYKLKNPDVVEWLDDSNYYSTLVAVGNR